MSSETSAEKAKAQLRKQLRWERKERFIDASWLHILQCKEFNGVTHVASYISYGVEPQTQDLNTELLKAGKVVIVPRLLPNKDLEWDYLESGKPFTDLSLVGVVIVPALHVDREGHRMGQGGGSYDRALPRFNAWKIALIHHGELTSEPMPVEEHDAKVDAAATPDLVVRFL